MVKRQLPVGVSQTCWMAPCPETSAIVKTLFALMRTEGDTFQPRPSSRAAFWPVPSLAIPPRPFSPVRFSGLIERVRAFDSRDSEPMPMPRPSKPSAPVPVPAASARASTMPITLRGMVTSCCVGRPCGAAPTLSPAARPRDRPLGPQCRSKSAITGRWSLAMRERARRQRRPDARRSGPR